ncbi:MAG: hypothetical protein LBH18_06205 [Spirochaetaceae bacterium]|nr:hypothetical protein [Spirochaetaceae bacterium]
MKIADKKPGQLTRRGKAASGARAIRCEISWWDDSSGGVFLAILSPPPPCFKRDKSSTFFFQRHLQNLFKKLDVGFAAVGRTNLFNTGNRQKKMLFCSNL